MIRIRRADRSDIEGIADVARDVWAQDVLQDVCEAQMSDDSAALWVATGEADEKQVGGLVGFVSAFLTVDARGHRRWEVDLLAVRKERQGEGLGTQLIDHVCRAGEAREISLARALIRVENIASQRAFEKAGFTTDGRVYRLILWSPPSGHGCCLNESAGQGSTSIHTNKIALLPVDTLMYRGLWIEGLTSARAEEQRQTLRTARSILARERRDNAGAPIPVDEVSRLATDVFEGGVAHGEYLWFVRPGGRT